MQHAIYYGNVYFGCAAINTQFLDDAYRVLSFAGFFLIDFSVSYDTYDLCHLFVGCFLFCHINITLYFLLILPYLYISINVRWLYEFECIEIIG